MARVAGVPMSDLASILVGALTGWLTAGVICRTGRHDSTRDRLWVAVRALPLGIGIGCLLSLAQRGLVCALTH